MDPGQPAAEVCQFTMKQLVAKLHLFVMGPGCRSKPDEDRADC